VKTRPIWTGVWNSDSSGIMGKTFLTPAETAGVLRVSRSTVYAMVDSGELLATRVRGVIRITSQSVRDYVERDL